MICSKCGKETKRAYPGQTCQGCYRYFLNGGTINKIPRPGEIKHDSRGYVVCHICGRAYKRLGSHIKESHDLTIAKYKEIFELCNCAKTTESNYSEHMKLLAYKNNMPLMLQRVGVHTRIQPGDNHLRFGKKVRLQERINKSMKHRVI